MSNSKLRFFIIISKFLYFGWLLSFPYYGPVIHSAAPGGLDVKELGLIFIFFHAATYLLSGIIFRNGGLWYKLMLSSLSVTIVTNAFLLLPLDRVWPPAMAILGVCSALYILGWCCLYSLYSAANERLKIMAAVMILSNLVFVLFNILTPYIPATFLLLLTLLPLVVALVFIFLIPVAFSSAPQRKRATLPLPKGLLFILCFFILILYINGGLLYSAVYPTFENFNLQFKYARYGAYIIVLVPLYWKSASVQRHNLLYYGVSLLGLGFVSFAFGNQFIAFYTFSAEMVEAAFALLDLFLWTTLASLAFIYRSPFQIFGFAIAVNIMSIMIGDYLGQYLFLFGELYTLFTALFALVTIFLAFMLMPLLRRHINQNLKLITDNALSEDSQINKGILEGMDKCLLPKQKLTTREKEIIAHVLQGLTNKEVAAKLNISYNTIKTHMRNIYVKFGVAKKRELIVLITKYSDVTNANKNSLSNEKLK